MNFLADYGILINKVENVYKSENSISANLEAILAKYDSVIKANGGKINYADEKFAPLVNDVKALLKANYVSIASNETLYDYFREKLYTNFAGNGSSTGTYFLAQEYKWLSDLYNTDKIKYIDKLTYEDLVDALS